MLFGWVMIVCTVDCPQIIDEKLLLDFVKGCDLWCPLNGLPLTILSAWVMTRAFECKLWTLLLLLLYLNSGATKEPKNSWSHVGKKIELNEAWKNIWDFELHWAIAFVVLLKKMFLSSLFFLIFCLKQFCQMLMQKGSNSNNTIDSAWTYRFPSLFRVHILDFA